MNNINTENREAVILAAHEILESGILWINLDGEALYVPDLIESIRNNTHELE